MSDPQSGAGSKRGNNSTPFSWEQKHRGHLDVTPPLRDRKRQSIALARQRRILAEPQQDPIEPYIPGRYEDVEGRWSFQVNQGGTHIEVWMSEVVDASVRRPKQFLRLAGDREDERTLRLYLPDKPQKKIGTAVKRYKSGTKHLDVKLEGQEIEIKFDAVQTSNYPVLSESAMETIPPNQPEVRLSEWSPLVRSQREWLRTNLSAEKLGKVIQPFFEAGDGAVARNTRHELLMELDEFVGRVFSTAPPDGWHPDDIPLVRFVARGVLATQYLTINKSKRSCLDWMQAMMSVSTGELAWKKNAVHMPENLRLIPAASGKVSSKPIEYEVNFAVAGFSGELIVSIGGWVGPITVRKKTPPTWEKMYDLSLFQIGAGVGVGVQVGQQNDGSGHSNVEYAPDDIPGPVTLMSAGVHAGPGSAGPGFLIIHGSGSLPDLSFDLTSLWSWNAEFGAGIDVLQMMLGHIFRPGEANKVIEDPAKVLRDEDYSAVGEHADEIHFRLGDALLTEDARQLLRIVCARELKSFRDAGSILTIIGHADRVDTEERNIELSRLRALNTLQAIKDTLGSDLRITPEKTVVLWMGEKHAKEEGDRDGFPNPDWRKVEIILNHRLILNLRSS